MRVGIGAIFKNECPYILEWIAFHRVVGVDQFFIADNNSNDGSTELLSSLDAAGIIEHIPFPTQPDTPPQMAAYEQILSRHRADVDWIAFIDADEFLLPTDGNRTIRGPMEKFLDRRDVGAIAVNWAVYGSSSHETTSDEPVISRFTKRAEKRFPVNAHFKSIVRSSACDQRPTNPHIFDLLPGRSYFSSDGSLAKLNEGTPGLTQEVNWGNIRINHYVVKSRNEFMYRKRARGRATLSNQLRPERFFDSHDRNEVHDPVSDWLLSETKRELARIVNKIGDISAQLGMIAREQLSEAIGEDTVFSNPLKSTIAAIKPKRMRSSIDSISVRGVRAVVRGWALTASGTAVDSIIPMLDGLTIGGTITSRQKRPDVVRHFRGEASEDCGFLIEIFLDEALSVFSTAKELTLCASADDPSQLLSFGKSVPWPADLVATAFKNRVSVPEIPVMPTACFDHIVSLMRNSMCYLEYGTGGTTVQASKIGVKNIIAVESDESWRDSLVLNLISGGMMDNQQILYADIGPTIEWGSPKNDESWKKFSQYPLGAWKYCRENRLYPDLILIDGRFRVSCCLASFIFARPGTRVLFDDYGDRPYYWSVERFIRNPRRVSRMAEFIVPDALDKDELWLAFTEASSDAR